MITTRQQKTHLHLVILASCLFVLWGKWFANSLHSEGAAFPIDFCKCSSVSFQIYCKWPFWPLCRPVGTTRG